MKQTLNDISYSLRRYYLDEFFEKNISIFNENAKIIDLGGKKANKRGNFNIEEYNLDVKYANISEKTEPDYLCDIKEVPAEGNSFDGFILSEVLEHVPNPAAVLKEAFRLIKPGSKGLICTPFIFHVHADPYDYGRYTEYWYRENLEKIGFKNIHIETQGRFFSVLSGMVKFWAYELLKSDRLKSGIKRKALHKFVFWFQKKALSWEHRKYYLENKAFSGYTTGYGIVCEKPMK